MGIFSKMNRLKSRNPPRVFLVESKWNFEAARPGTGRAADDQGVACFNRVRISSTVFVERMKGKGLSDETAG